MRQQRQFIYKFLIINIVTIIYKNTIEKELALSSQLDKNHSHFIFYEEKKVSDHFINKLHKSVSLEGMNNRKILFKTF